VRTISRVDCRLGGLRETSVVKTLRGEKAPTDSGINLSADRPNRVDRRSFLSNIHITHFAPMAGESLPAPVIATVYASSVRRPIALLHLQLLCTPRCPSAESDCLFICIFCVVPRCFLSLSHRALLSRKCRRFAERYYNTLHTDPSELYSFYSADASFERWESTQAANEALKVRRSELHYVSTWLL
jgi:hypothetical protein